MTDNKLPGFTISWARSWKFMMGIVTPILLLPVLFIPKPDIISDAIFQTTATTVDAHGSCLDPCKYRLAYVVLVMAVYWAFEIIPLPVTALFPLVLFPLLGIDDAAHVSKSYMRESSTIFLGGAIVALAVENCNLHRRVALRLITTVGVSPIRLMFGIMTVVSFLSMWISNTTCVTMLAPVIVAIVDEIYAVEDVNAAISDNTLVLSQLDQNDPTRNSNKESHWIRLQQEVVSFQPPPRIQTWVFANAGLRSHHSRGRGRGIGRGGLNLNHHRNQVDPVANSITSHVRSRGFHGRGKSHRRPSNYEDAPVPLDILKDPTNESIVSDASSKSSADSEKIQERRALKERRLKSIKSMYLFGLGYAAIIGGTATITGTGPNKIFKEVMKPYSKDISQNGKGLGMTFFTWMAFNVPPMIINVVIAWAYLIIRYIGISRWKRRGKAIDKALLSYRNLMEKHVKEYLVKEHKRLGKMTFHEISVIIIFLLVIILWILRDPQLFPGWNEFVSNGMSGDSTPALLGAVLLFIIPRSWDFLTSKDESVTFEALLDWKTVSDRLPWGLLLLLGSGYAIGDSAHRTGLAKRIADYLHPLDNMPGSLVLLTLMFITSIITEVVSNTAAATIILPILFGLSHEWGVHPLFLTVGAAVAASYAFMLPVASPVNAIIFAAGDFSIWEMIVNGYIIKGISLIVVYVNTLTLGEALFQYSEFTRLGNSTIAH